MRPALLILLTVTLGAAAACSPAHYTLRLDGGYQTPVGQDPRHDGYFAGTAGGGVQLRNKRGRIAVTAEAAARPAADGVLFALESDLLVFWIRDDYHRNLGKGIFLKETSRVALSARVAAGPAFGEHAQIVEAALGVGIVGDSIAYYNDHRGIDVDRFFDMVAFEGFATRTAGDDHDDWMIGGRLSFTLPLNVVDLVLAQRRTSKDAAPPWPGPRPWP
jgi:hypothetical protein